VNCGRNHQLMTFLVAEIAQSTAVAKTKFGREPDFSVTVSNGKFGPPLSGR
jgi:hypothetical protein